MRAVLVNPPHSEYDRNEIGPPLGLLRLAGVARKTGWDADIVDFNLLWHTTPKLRHDFVTTALSTLLQLDADIYGFTSMAVDSHVALELAKQVKEHRPDARIFVGGTHFSAIHRELSDLFPFIDAVVCGEGEGEFTTLLSGIAPIGEANSRLSRTSVDYNQVDLAPYFSVNRYRTIDVESARGCRFNCAFCYSPKHYPTRRSLDFDQLLRELSFLADGGTRHVFFVDDNFLNDPEQAVSMCDALSEAKLGLTWHCYATLPQIKPVVVTSMAKAGCRAVFTGIDAIGLTSERQYGKRFSLRAAEKIQLCSDHGIIPTCAFLLAPPSHACGEDAEQTIRAALAARTLGAEIRLNILTYYAGTRLASRSAGDFSWDEKRVRLGMDVPDVVAANPLAVALPRLFPFHARYVAEPEWNLFTQQVHVLFTLLHARSDELADIAKGRALNFLSLADEVLTETGNLLALNKLIRRKLEVEAFDAIYAYSNKRGYDDGKTRKVRTDSEE